MQRQAYQVFQDLGIAHAKLIEGERPTLKFLAVLRELFVTKKVYVLSTEGTCPEDHHDWGWKNYDDPGHAEHIGWVDADFIYLLPEMAYRAVQEAIRKQGAFLGPGKSSLYRDLIREGVVECGNDKTTKPKKIGGRLHRCLWLRKESLEPGAVTP